jgi:hypothetical protein
MNLNAVRSHALFVSSLQRSERPTVGQVRDAIVRAVRDLGAAECAARVAQEFGDHPELATARMRWAIRMVAEVYAWDEAYERRQRDPARSAGSAGPPFRYAS